MNQIHWRLGERFSGQWIKVKFYKKKPDLKEGKYLEKIRFCEATQQAVLTPILLNKESISCPRALYAFGWDSKKGKIVKGCRNKRKTTKQKIQTMFDKMPFLEKPFNYIGLNTDGEPDVVLSYLQPAEVMKLINIYHNNFGKSLEITLSNMMSICGSAVVRCYLSDNISFSFACEESRKYAKIGRDRLAVAIPKRLFIVFGSP
jgi:uncharacterized protein (DUF169 family)